MTDCRGVLVLLRWERARRLFYGFSVPTGCMGRSWCMFERPAREADAAREQARLRGGTPSLQQSSAGGSRAVVCSDERKSSLTQSVSHFAFRGTRQSQSAPA
jgi:hypothetical protein